MVNEKRFQHSMSGARTGIFVNAALVLIKVVAGIMAGSIAMLADALHSFSDIIASTVVFIGIRVASKPPDEGHPYGHGRAETIASKIVAIIIILAGLNIGFFSLRALFHTEHPVPGMAALWAALLSILVNEGLFRYSYRIGRLYSCKTLIANAFENRSDALSSLAALAGIGGARLGLVLGMPQLFFLDPLAGLVVSAMILRMGWQLACEAASELMDGQAEPSFTDELRKLILDTDGVVEVHRVRARMAGPYCLVDLEIGVDGRITVREGHDVAAEVKKRLFCDVEEISDVLVHVNPCRGSADGVKEGLPGE